MLERISIKTKSRNQLVDITREVRGIVVKSGVIEGIVVLYVTHTTAAVTVNEGADPDVADDICEGLSNIAPNKAAWKHSEGNSDSHVKCSLVSPSISLIIDKGDVILGTWQKIFFCEFDGPRTRSLMVKVIKG